MTASWLLIFLLNATLDIVYARYTISVQHRHPIIAAHWAAAIILIGGISIISYTHDPVLIFPAAAGAWLGTWVAVGRSKDNEGA